MIARLLSWDERLFQYIGSLRPRALIRVMRALTHLGDAQSWIVIGLFLLFCGGQARQVGLLLGSAATIAALVSQVVKRSLKRPRPSTRGFTTTLGGRLEMLVENPDAFSFPSGHAASAFAIAIAIAGHGTGLGTLSLVLAAGIGCSRVFLGAHYPLDVAAGAILGTGCGVLARFIAG